MYNKWVDTHCHLYSDNVNVETVDSLIKGIKEELEFAITIGTTPKDCQLIVERIDKINNLFGTVGIHPGHVSKWNESFEGDFKKWYRLEKIVAIGEIGLDYHYPDYDINLQKKIFATQLQIAQDIEAPVVIHARDSVIDCLSILKDFPSLKKVVFHCFTGNMSEAEAVLEQGYHISFTGVITFPKSEYIRDIAKIVPLNRIMLETDTPYLTPVPFRGKENSPVYVSYVGELVAKLLNQTNEETQQITANNAKEFFNIPRY